MKRAAALIAILLAVVATGCASAPTRATDAALLHRAPTEKTVVVNCLFKPQTHPSSFVLTCADANDVLADLHWVSWGSAAAFATGIEQINNCTPYCAAGKFINYPILVDLWRPEPLPGHPRVLYFSRVTRVYTANRPPLYFCHGTRTCYPQTSTFDLWSWSPPTRPAPGQRWSPPTRPAPGSAGARPISRCGSSRDSGRARLLCVPTNRGPGI